MTKPQWIQSSSRKEREAAWSYGPYCQLSPGLVLVMILGNVQCNSLCLWSRKANLHLLVSFQRLYKFLRLRIFSDNAWRARIKAQQVHGLHLSRFQLPWTWHPPAKWKGRAAQNIQEYCRKEDEEGGLPGNTQHFFRSVKTDDKQKIKQQPEWPPNTKYFSPSVLTKRPCFSPVVPLNKSGANPSSSKSLRAFSALRVACLLLGQVSQEWKKNSDSWNVNAVENLLSKPRLLCFITSHCNTTFESQIYLLTTRPL